MLKYTRQAKIHKIITRKRKSL